MAEKQMKVYSKSTIAVLNGTDDVANWDDEELLQARRRDKHGNFSGKPPWTVVPAAIHSELTRRRMRRAQEVLRENLVGAVELWASVMKDREVPLAYRIECSKLITDRVMGKPVDRIQMDTKVDMSVSIEEAPWAVALRKAARTLDGKPVPGFGGVIPAPSTDVSEDIVDAEIVEDNPLCACGCGQPAKEGEAYFNLVHRSRAEGRAQAAQPRPAPAPEDLAAWNRNMDDDPNLFDDDDFVPDDEDDPVLTDD